MGKRPYTLRSALGDYYHLDVTDEDAVVGFILGGLHPDIPERFKAQEAEIALCFRIRDLRADHKAFVKMVDRWRRDRTVTPQDEDRINAVLAALSPQLVLVPPASSPERATMNTTHVVPHPPKGPQRRDWRWVLRQSIGNPPSRCLRMVTKRAPRLKPGTREVVGEGRYEAWCWGQLVCKSCGQPAASLGHLLAARVVHAYLEFAQLVSMTPREFQQLAPPGPGDLRQCPRCGDLLPFGKRRDALYCSKRCAAAARAARYRENNP